MGEAAKAGTKPRAKLTLPQAGAAPLDAGCGPPKRESVRTQAKVGSTKRQAAEFSLMEMHIDDHEKPLRDGTARVVDDQVHF